MELSDVLSFWEQYQVAFGVITGILSGFVVALSIAIGSFLGNFLSELIIKPRNGVRRKDRGKAFISSRINSYGDHIYYRDKFGWVKDFGKATLYDYYGSEVEEKYNELLNRFPNRPITIDVID